MDKIQKKNLLILGAGASIDMQPEISKEQKEAGYIGLGKYTPYPLGDELIKAIINKKDLIHAYFINNILAKIFGTDDLITEMSGEYNVSSFSYGDKSNNDKKYLVNSIRSLQQKGDKLLNPALKHPNIINHSITIGGSGKSYISVLAYPDMLTKLNLSLPILSDDDKVNEKNLTSFDGHDMTHLALACNFKIPENKFIEAEKYIDLMVDYFNIINNKFYSIGFLSLAFNKNPIYQEGTQTYSNRDGLIQISKYFEDNIKATKEILEVSNKPESKILIALDNYKNELLIVRDDKSWAYNVSEQNNVSKSINIQYIESNQCDLTYEEIINSRGIKHKVENGYFQDMPWVCQAPSHSARFIVQKLSIVYTTFGPWYIIV